MDAAAEKVRPAEEVRGVLESWLEAVRARDVPRIIAHYAPDIVAYDAIQALRFQGREAYEAHWDACMAMCHGDMIFQLHEPTITASGDLGFVHGLVLCGARDEHGEEKKGWTRMTSCYRKLNGRWRVVHEHFSAPFDCETGKALWDLQP
jgi:ketosteroid isomerase-like protein